jgi:hypothetical protein
MSSGVGFPKDSLASPEGAAIAANPVCDGRAPHLAGRTPEFVKQLAVHEIGHTVTARSLGTTVLRTTIEPTASYAGRCFRRGAGLSHFDDDAAPDAGDESLLEICARCPPPSFGESPIAIAEGRARAEVAIVELVAGRVAERVIIGTDIEPLDCTLDYAEARALARTLCQPSAVSSLLAHAESEASAIISANRDTVDALVERLIELGSMDGDEIDAAIIAAIAARSAQQEATRRHDWARRVEGAKAFDQVREEKEGSSFR